MSVTPPIYQPKGHAAPYAELALNPYLTCPFRCPYCYNAVRNPAFFSDTPKIRCGSPEKLLAALEKQCAEWVGYKPDVHMTFLGDCYQPAEAELKLTRQCIEKLHWHDFPVQILTKARQLPARDFDLLNHDDYFGVTMVKPDADRLALLRCAYSRGINTWLSLEPVLNADDAAAVLGALADAKLNGETWVWIGPLNHGVRGYDWAVVKELLRAEAEAYAIEPHFKDDARSG